MRIAYLTNCFGAQSHTFIRREIAELGKLGVEVELFGLRKAMSEKLTPAEQALVARTVYLYPLQILRIIGLNLYWMLTRPGRYWPTLWVALTNKEDKMIPHLKLVYHFFVALYLAQAIKGKQVDHIHAHFLNVSSTMAMYVSLLTGIPYSVTVHSAGTKNAPHIIGIALKLKYAQFLMMISHYNIDYFDAIFPCKNKATVVRCGMDLEQYPFRKPREVYEVARPLSILAVGRLVEKKGFRYLIETIKILKDKNINVRLEIVGSGPLESELKQCVTALNLHDEVTFLGPASTEEVRAKMLDADVVVVPSVTGSSGEMEGIPVVLMEAMALGVPVVSTRHSGIPELVRQGETGTIVAEKDPVALALALLSLMQELQELKSNSRYSARVKKARELIENEFNNAVVAQQRRDLFIEYHKQNMNYEPVNNHTLV